MSQWAEAVLDEKAAAPSRPVFQLAYLTPFLNLLSMHAARLVRPIRAANRQFSRSLSAAAATPTTRATEAVIPLSNVEAQWEKLTTDEQLVVHQQLEELQKRDWKTLSLDEKKAGVCTRLFLFLRGLQRGYGITISNSPLIYAAYYVAFGPHGPRADLHPPGSVPKLILSVVVGVFAGGALYLTSRAFGGSRQHATCFFSDRADRDLSRPASEDHDQGMAGGVERTRSRAKPRPHYW